MSLSLCHSFRHSLTGSGIRYLATGGADTMINLYETDSWICSQTIVGCESVSTSRTCLACETQSISSYSINGLSFSHDGEFIAVATQGTMMDIVSSFCALENLDCTNSISCTVCYRNRRGDPPCYNSGTNPEHCLASFKASHCLLRANTEDGNGTSASCYSQSFWSRSVTACNLGVTHCGDMIAYALPFAP